MPALTIALLGATGNVGGHYARLALDAGHSLRALARNPAKLDPIIPNGADHPNVIAIAGDATNPDDIANLIKGADVVVSCLGNPTKGVHIMTAAANNVLEVAAKQPEPPRCIFISSVGMGGTSWFIYKVLELIGRDTPPKVAITEYVDVAKAFFEDGDEPKFVNAVLDHMAREAKPEAF